MELPQRARVVIIGGGIIGCSVAYHLAQMGWTDVVVVEQHRLTAGTTWHAAGLMVTFGSTSQTSTEMRTYTRDLYARLEQETGLATGFAPVGFVELATEPDRLEEYRRIAAFNRICGVDVHEISAREVGGLFPLARTDDILAGFFVPTDGRANPVDVTMSLARGARQLGVSFVQGVAVTGVQRENERVTGVRTDHGDIEAEYVVNCAGMWARQLGQEAGVAIALQAAEHYYLITEQIEGIGNDWPVIEDPASHGYYREEVGGLMIGLFEPQCAPWHVDAIPADFSFGEISPDWDRMAPYLERAMSRVPVSLDIGVRKFFCGPESFTPDLSPIVGEAPELRNYFVAAGMNSIGILTGGGLGRVVAHWIINGAPDVDVTAMNIDRLQLYQTNPEYRRSRTVEALGMVYQCHYPARSMTSARNARVSPLHQRLLDRGAHFKEVSGWEAADWFDPSGSPSAPQLSWVREPWFEFWALEHQAARTGVVLIDMSFMSKFAVNGRDAGRFLNHLSANEVDGPAGRITYTQWLNEQGTIEADLTVIKRKHDDFIVVATDTAHRHVETWMQRHISQEHHVSVHDCTSSLAQINIQGPLARQLMQAVADADFANERFAYRDAIEVPIGFARVLCVRISYVGELGYELYVPTEQALHVYDRLVAAGEVFGLRHAGLKALGSLRMEKAYRDYGHDIDNTDDVFAAGLGFAVDLYRPQPFIGRLAVEAAVGRPLHQRLVQILVTDPDPMMYHAEVVLRNGAVAGYIRSASYGHTLGGAVGLAMVSAAEPITAALLAQSRWDVDIAGRRYPAKASLRPMYDPTSDRMKQ